MRTLTTIRAPEAWMGEVKEAADELGLSQTAVILLTVRIGLRLLRRLPLTKRQIASLMDGCPLKGGG